MEMPLYRILPPDADRRFWELNPESADTLVVSLHQDAWRDLTCSSAHYEAGALLRIVLGQAAAERDTDLVSSSFQVDFCLGAIDLLSPGEVLEEVDRLVARGYVERVGPRGVRVNPLVARVIERSEVPARIRMAWNAAKADWSGHPSAGT